MSQKFTKEILRHFNFVMSSPGFKQLVVVIENNEKNSYPEMLQAK